MDQDVKVVHLESFMSEKFPEPIKEAFQTIEEIKFWEEYHLYKKKTGWKRFRSYLYSGILFVLWGLLITGSWLLDPAYGAIGALCAAVAVFVVGSPVIVAWFFPAFIIKHLRKDRKNPEHKTLSRILAFIFGVFAAPVITLIMMAWEKSLKDYLDKTVMDKRKDSRYAYLAELKEQVEAWDDYVLKMMKKLHGSRERHISMSDALPFFEECNNDREEIANQLSYATKLVEKAELGEEKHPTDLTKRCEENQQRANRMQARYEAFRTTLQTPHQEG